MLDITVPAFAKAAFEYFEKITKIPRGSGNCGPIADYLVKFATEHSLDVIRDEWDNVIIKKGASDGYESHPAVILQGHTDMVAEKTDECEIDMTCEGIEAFVDGDYIRARGTTLGGDDGAAVAYMLAILADNTLKHPPIEALFTSDEEIGLIGAGKLDASALSGKTLINIDSEEEGVFTVGCAGGVRVDMTQSKRASKKYFGRLFTLTVSGLLGGHSGVEIDKGRANAARLTGLLLRALGNICIASSVGGNMDNAIMRSCETRFVKDASLDEVKSALLSVTQKIKSEFAAYDPDITVEVTESIGDATVFDEDASADIVALMTSLPSGAIKMSEDIEGLVQTSANIGVVRIDASADSSYVTSSLRSSKANELSSLKDSFCKTARAYGFGAQFRGEYPSWEYRKNSPLRDASVALYRELYGKDPVVLTIHAGLECGAFSEKIDGLDCISIGPQMHDIHTTEERLSISSTVRVYDFIIKLLERL